MQQDFLIDVTKWDLPTVFTRITEPDSELVSNQPTGEALEPDLSLSERKSSDVSSCMVSKYIYCWPMLPWRNKSASKKEVASLVI